MQGCYNFRGLAINVVVEVAVKFGGALLFLHFGMGVTGVMTAVLLSIVAAYIAGKPGAEYRRQADRSRSRLSARACRPCCTSSAR